MTGAQKVFVSFSVAGQQCGLPVTMVRDVLRHQPIAPVALAPPEVAGNINLRGRIVTAIDIRRRLGLPPHPPPSQMALVTETDGELFALLVDQVCEVLSPEAHRFEPPPPTLPPHWTRFATGLFRLDHALMLVLDLPRLLALAEQPA